jgi:probable rRNA maturation factor
VGAALNHESIADASISVTLLNDARISALNEQYLEHPGPTDVISFPLFQQGEPPVGDIYIGFDQARRQAAELSVGLEAELARLAIHGTLHVLGYDHPEDGAREGSEMWQVQESILRQVLEA